ncbi:hypothetical protein BJ912DRAFT_1060281 [Pholiota molesta]|nr:hypothetical protein BJ912DRAFT_1060281 [Pholiota molesta]
MSATDTEQRVQDTTTPFNDPSSRAAFLQRTYSPLPPSLLHTSFTPSPEEEITIRESIHDIKTTLCSVDDEIARVHATLSALEEYRSALHRTLAYQQSSLSPIRRLPPEIWGEIFLFASAGSAIRCGPRSETDQEDIPLLLCQICSYWRTVAISVPALWSNIRLDLLDMPLLLTPGVLSVLGLCLARSKNEPLTLSFEGKVVMHSSILETLMAHSERWKDVSLMSDMLFDSHTILGRAKNLRVPNLRRLCINTACDYGTIPRSRLLAFKDAPSLRELSLTDVMHPFQCLRISWSQLTHFSSKRSIFAEGEFTLIMRHMPALVSFFTESERILEVASTAPVLLPHLRQLSITNKGSYISKTCQFLTAPNLEALAISAVTPFDVNETVAMLERSRCKPQQLILRTSLDPGTVWDENLNVVWLLASVPSLARLELTVANAGMHILSRLADRARSGSPPTPPTQRAPLLPALEKLVLEDRLCTSASGITDALEWRVVGGPSLRSVDLRLFPPASPKFDELDSFKRMAEDHGVELSVFSG